MFKVYKVFYIEWILRCMLFILNLNTTMQFITFPSVNNTFTVKSEKELVESGHWDEMAHTFNELYESQLSQIRTEIDFKELGAVDFIFNQKATSDEMQNKGSIQKTVVSSLTDAWNDINNATNSSSGSETVDTISDSLQCKRINFVMELFSKLVIQKFIINKPNADNDNESNINDTDFMDIFEQLFFDRFGYTTAQLLDDFDHIQENHMKNESECLQFSTCPIDCNFQFCIHDLLTDYRDHRANSLMEKEEQNNMQYKNLLVWIKRLNAKQLTVLSLVSKIHFVFNHQIIVEQDKNKDDDINARSLLVRSRKRVSSDKENKTYSKFVNDIDGLVLNEEEQGKGGLSDGIYDILVKKGGMTKQKANELLIFLKNNGYESESIMDDICDYFNHDPFNQYRQSNIFNELSSDTNNPYYLMKIIKNQLNIHHQNDNDPIPSFTFGEAVFVHTKQYKEYPQFAIPKYSSLKEECLNNSIHCIDLLIWQELLAAAQSYYPTKTVKKLRAADKAAKNLYDEVPVQLGVAVSHLIVVLMYCNYTELQAKYKKHGTRKSHPNQGHEDLMKHHQEICRWYKLLKELIRFFGTRCKKGDVFYTGMSIRLSFESFQPEFRAPFSTSTEHTIATKFSQGIGCVIKLSPLQSTQDYYFDVQKFSQYPDEKEKLFMAAYELQLMDIEYFSGIQTYTINKWLSALKFLSQLLQGNYVFIPFKTKHKTAQKNLIQLLKVYKVYNNVDRDHNVMDIDDIPKIPIYVQQLFFNQLLALQKQYVHVIPSQCELINPVLGNDLLIIKDDKPVNGHIFNHLQITPSVIKIYEEYHWILSEEELNKFKKGKPDERITYDGDMKYRSSVIFGVDICRKYGGSEFTGIAFLIKETKGRIVSGNYTVMVDEAGFTKSNWEFNDKSKGGTFGSQFFFDLLVDQLPSLSIHISIYFE